LVLVNQLAEPQLCLAKRLEMMAQMRHLLNGKSVEHAVAQAG
jgi:hypothetical protein